MGTLARTALEDLFVSVLLLSTNRTYAQLDDIPDIVLDEGISHSARPLDYDYGLDRKTRD